MAETDARIAEIRERLERATLWPWVRSCLSVSGPLHKSSKHPDGRVHIAQISSGRNRIDSAYACDGAAVEMAGDGFSDANLIAHAPDDLHFLLEALVAKDSEIAGLKSLLAEKERMLAVAIKDMKKMADVYEICFPCKHFIDLKNCALPGDECHFEWRGVCDANWPAKGA